MRVVQINALGSTLSTGRTTREMHNYFLEHGIESYIATACNKDCDDAYAISSMYGMHLDTALSIVTGLELYHSRLQTKKFLRYLDTIKPDIVHLRVLHNSFINIGMLLRYLAKKDIATVITLHDFWFITGKCCYYHNYPCDKWKNGCYECIAMKDDARHRWFDRTHKMWTDKKKWLNAIPRLAVVGNSDWTANEARKSFIINKKDIYRVYNWIDLEKFYPRDAAGLRRDLGMEHKFIILGVSATWSEHNRKGFDDYIKLSEILPSRYQIVLVGELSYNKKIPRNITILNKTNDIDLLALYYSMADVYLNLSIGETFGKVSAEAAACGTPIIALDATANSEVVPPDAGIVISSADQSEIMEAIHQIEKTDKSYYKQKCLSYVSDLFEKDKNIDQYIKIYENLLTKTSHTEKVC